jgi:hypothetical protein
MCAICNKLDHILLWIKVSIIYIYKEAYTNMWLLNIFKERKFSVWKPFVFYISKGNQIMFWSDISDCMQLKCSTERQYMFDCDSEDVTCVTNVINYRMAFHMQGKQNTWRKTQEEGRKDIKYKRHFLLNFKWAFSINSLLVTTSSLYLYLNFYM